jgi:hypothetical protein
MKKNIKIIMSCRRVHFKKEDYDIYVGRPSKWGSPFSYKENTIAKYKVKSRKESIEKHKEWLLHGEGQYLLNDLHELKDKTLGCWCNPNQSCHADILVKLVNNLDKKGLEDILF